MQIQKAKTKGGPIMQNLHKMPLDGNPKQFLDLEKYYQKKPAIINKYYQTNLIMLVDRLDQALTEQDKKKREQYIQKKQKKLKQKNNDPVDNKEEQLLLDNVTSVFHHETDRLNQDIEVNDYKFSNLLGRGAHSVVREAKQKTQKGKQTDPKKQGQVYAVKILWLDKIRKKYFIKPKDLLNMVSNEIILLKKLKHPNIIQFKDAIYLKQKQRLFLVIEHCSKGSIMKIINQNLTIEGNQWWSIVQKYFRQFVAGVNYMHQNGIVHRDIKPDNLLVNKLDQLKIIDFNVSAKSEQNGLIKVSNKFIGTKGYAAPQLILDLENVKMCDGRKIDVWAMAITLIELLQKKHPYPVKTLPELVKILQNHEKQEFLWDQKKRKSMSNPQLIRIMINDEYPKQLQDLLKKMIQFQNKQRLLVSQIMKHPWVK